MKIKNDFFVGEVREIHPKIFAVKIKDKYERGMLFCRYQEFYESPYKEIRGKHFTLEQFMSLYRSKTKKDTFTYPYDWTGYNIPSSVLLQSFSVLKNRNHYDDIMKNIFLHCHRIAKSKWYLLGVDNFSSDILKHELAHGLYYTNDQYKKEMKDNLDSLYKSDYSYMKKALIKMGYRDDGEIIDDEIQAYLSTGIIRELNNGRTNRYTNKFSKTFSKFLKNKN